MSSSRNSLTLFLFLLTSCATTKTSIQHEPRPFRAVLDRMIETKGISLPDLPSVEFTQKKIPFPEPSLPRWKNILKIYKSALPQNISSVTFEVQKLGTQYRLPHLESAPVHFNDSIVYAVFKNKVLRIFRPVEVSTGCDSGCTPVIFHLEFSPLPELENTFELTKILVEKEFKLLKIYHQVLTDDEISKLLRMAQKIPSLMEHLESPSQTTNANSSFPRQTWTFAEPFSVSGGAYTSHRVLLAAKKTFEFLGSSEFKNISSGDQDPKGAPWLLAHYERRERFAALSQISNLAEANQFANQGIATLGSEATQNVLFTFYGQSLAHLGVWTLQEFQNPYILEKLESHPLFQSAYKNYFCKAIKLLLHSPSSRSYLTKKLQPKSSSANAYSCHPYTDKILLFLSQNWDEKSKLNLKKAFLDSQIHFDFEVLAHWDPELLKDLLSLIDRIDEPKLLLDLLAQWTILYPLDKSSPIDGLLKKFHTTQAFSDEFLEAQRKYTLVYRNQLQRTLSFVPRNRIQKFEIVADEKKSKSNFANLMKGKRILIFFGSWCPHCQFFFKQLGKSPLQNEIFQKGLFVEIFKNDQADLKSFCKMIEWSNEQCSALKSLNETSIVSKQFLEAHSVASVPRVMILDEQGGIALDHVEFQNQMGSDPFRDLLILSELADSNNPAMRADPQN